MNRTFFTFDKTFGEDTTTRQVYDTVAKGIVDSVVSGLNGTIFAYGQTSSGKTFTMQGSGSIEEGSTNGGGVVHMAAHDIFSYISNTTDRVFLVRASFVEIYNEEVRDLLGANSILQVREDPQRGVFVNSEEIIATDFSSLLEILFSGEKNRAVAATGMNERSSRSHTIFRITIESRLKSDENDPNAANTSEEDGAVRVSTLNLVDLAGSESVRHTGNTGDRLKEGAKINQRYVIGHCLSRIVCCCIAFPHSILALSTVY
jgi:centromeric protein E